MTIGHNRRFEISTDPVEVMFVCMPWQCESLPSIQIGLLSSLLNQASISADTLHANLDFVDYVVSRDLLRFSQYQFMAQRPSRQLGLAEWLFLVPPIAEIDPDRDERYREFIENTEFQRPEEREMGRSIGFETLLRVRESVPAFVDQVADEISSRKPKVVGFTTMFFQTNASLAVAKVLKERRPDISIVFGGASCEGVSGEALHRNNPCIDVVVRGEAEPVLLPLFRELLHDRELTPRPGLCIRQNGTIDVTPQSRHTSSILDAPVPDYDEFFARLEDNACRKEISAELEVLFETARGCWWGAKHHCIFCGLNGQSMAFRSKTPDKVLDEIEYLAKRYRLLRLMSVDNILDNDYFRTLLPKLAERDLDLSIWVETKSNLKKDQMRLMRDSGFDRLNAGIESLSTPVLQIMKKGVTGLHNIRTLKWAAEFDIDIGWVILYGFPGEQPDDYARMADDMRSLFHLSPPNWPTPIRMDRFSPIHNDPAAFQLISIRPAPYYEHVYPSDSDTISELAYHFTFEYANGQQPESYIEPVKEAVSDWRNGQSGRLEYYRGPDFLYLEDSRYGAQRSRRFGSLEAKIYLLCDAGMSLSRIDRWLVEAGEPAVSRDRIAETLNEWCDARIMYVEDETYLSLALPGRGRPVGYYSGGRR